MSEHTVESDAHVLVAKRDGQYSCTCGYTPGLGEMALRAVDRHLAEIDAAPRPCSCGISVVGARTSHGGGTEWEWIAHVAYPADCYVTPPASTHPDRGHANANRVALTGLAVVGLGTGASFAHPYLAWWMIPLVLLWLLAGVAIACAVGGGERR